MLFLTINKFGTYGDSNINIGTNFLIVSLTPKFIQAYVCN